MLNSKRFLLFLLLFPSLCLAQVSERQLCDAFLTNDMPVWKQYIDSLSRNPSPVTPNRLSIEYGYCGAMMNVDKDAARPYVKQYRAHVEAAKGLPAGHYEMYMSAVYVYELRLHESFHPAKSLSLAREAVKLAPNDPLTLTYCGTALFYAPKPFGSKSEALELFLKADTLFQDPKWHDCWWRPAALMYIAQCYDKQGDTKEAIRRCQALLKEYPNYTFIRDEYLPQLLAK